MFFLSGDDIGIAVIISAPTGIIYENQCAGTSCLHKKLEGYYVPLGHPSSVPAASELLNFFVKFNCIPPDRRDLWEDNDIQKLASIVKSIIFWKSERLDPPFDGVQEAKLMSHLELNLDCIDELTEAWIPVKTADGPGVLVFDNCD